MTDKKIMLGSTQGNRCHKCSAPNNHHEDCEYFSDYDGEVTRSNANEEALLLRAETAERRLKHVDSALHSEESFGSAHYKLEKVREAMAVGDDKLAKIWFRAEYQGAALLKEMDAQMADLRLQRLALEWQGHQLDSYRALCCDCSLTHGHARKPAEEHDKGCVTRDAELGEDDESDGVPS